MNDPLPDNQVLLAIAATLLVIFALIFSVRPHHEEFGPSMQWKDQANVKQEFLQL